MISAHKMTEEYRARVTEWKEILGPDKIKCLEQLFIASGNGRPPQTEKQRFRIKISKNNPKLFGVLDKLEQIQLIETHSEMHDDERKLIHYYRLVPDALHLLENETAKKRVREMAEIYDALGAIYEKEPDGNFTKAELEEKSKTIKHTSKQAMYFLANLRSVLIYSGKTPLFPYPRNSKITLSENVIRYENFWNVSVRFAPRKRAKQQIGVVEKTAEEVEYDVFIIHASEDKDDFVRPLAETLMAQGLRVFYDESSVGWGENITSKIDKGLVNSRFGIVVLSPDFLKKPWPKRELDGLTQQELADATHVLPIFHRITIDEVRKFSPPLANIKAMDSSIHSIDEIVQAFVQTLSISPSTLSR